MLNNLVKNATYKEITYNEFIEMVNNDEVKSVALEQDRILITPVDSAGDTPEANKLGYTYYTQDMLMMTHLFHYSREKVLNSQVIYQILIHQ